MKIARTYICTFLIILLMCVSGCFDHTIQDTTGAAETKPSSGPTETTTVGTATEQTETTMTTTVPVTTELPTEPPVTRPDPQDSDFVRMVDYVPNLRQYLRYGTTDNFTGQVIYGFEDAYLRFGTAKKLAQAAEELEKLGFGILVWDGYRPLYAQQKLWDICPDPTYVSKPGTGRQTHCRGIAVDITLYDLETGALLEMPSDFDEFSAKGDRDYSDCTDAARKNALILEQAMERAGFQPYSGEWWHFADTEDYPIEEYFDPANP